jgi:hypothetical protein
MKSLLEPHYTATNKEIACEYEFATSASLTRKQSSIIYMIIIWCTL